jgi:hypothetical protein
LGGDGKVGMLTEDRLSNSKRGMQCWLTYLLSKTG